MALSRTPISKESHDLLMDFVQSTITHQGSWWREKLERTDLLYYCMQNDLRTSETLKNRVIELGMDTEEILEAPIIISQIETAVAVLADTFLSGYPLFGVVAPPERRQEIEQLETLIANYDKRGKWRASLLRYFRSLTKYGIAPAGIINRFGYDKVQSFGLPSGMSNDGNGAVVRNITPFILPDLRVPDLYNMTFDYRVSPNEVHLKGDYIAFAEMLPATALKAMLMAVAESDAQQAGQVFNLDKWIGTVTPHTAYYMHPVIAYPQGPSSSWDR